MERQEMSSWANHEIAGSRLQFNFFADGGISAILEYQTFTF
jgi:hypothetical protein